jgi:hypothetical protein
VVGAAGVYCAAGVVGVGPGAGLFHGDGSHAAPRAIVRPHIPAPPTSHVVPHVKPAAPSHSQPRHGTKTPHGNGRHTSTRVQDRHGHVYAKQSEAARHRQSLESAASEPEPTPEPAPEPEPSYVGEPETGGSNSSESAAHSQFGLP